MKKILVAIAVALVLSVPSMAMAEAGYNNGFYIANDDNTFKFKINGRIQPKYEFTKQGSTVRDPSDPTNLTFLPEKVSTFSIRRAYVKFTATIHDKLTARVGLLHSTNSANFSTVNATGATVSYAVMPEFIITAGMVGLPLDFITDTSSKWLVMPDWPITSTQDDGVQQITPLRSSFGAPDGLGLNFAGDISKFFYSLSIVNGAESNYAFNTNMRISAGARFGYNILGNANDGSQTDFQCSPDPRLSMSLGGNYSSKRTDPNTGANIKYGLTGSMGIALRWAGFALTTEAYFRRTRITAPGTAIWSRPRLDDFGYYATVGYYVIPKTLELAATGGQIFRQGPDNNSYQFGGGINWYIFDNNFKLQGAFTWNEDFDDVLGLENNNIYRGTLQLSAFF